MSLLAFTKICIAVHKSPTLNEYSKHPGLIGHMADLSSGYFKVTVSLGLHYGWAIEGAIGSEFKIDASYISPDVNVCQSVEGASTVFGVPLMMSQGFTERCSKSVRSEFRVVDHVLIQAAAKPFYLYSMDLDVDMMKVYESSSARPIMNETRLRKRMNRELRKRQKGSDDYDPAGVFLNDGDIMTARSKYPSSFFENYGVAVRNYDAGEWEVAREFFLLTQDMLGDVDMPSSCLLNYMAEFDFKCPNNWQGYRHFHVEEEQNRARQMRAGKLAADDVVDAKRRKTSARMKTLAPESPTQASSRKYSVRGADISASTPTRGVAKFGSTGDIPTLPAGLPSQVKFIESFPEEPAENLSDHPSELSDSL
jgi:hypothetical protein